MAGTRVVLTYRDYAALPSAGRRYEIHDGELSVTPAPGLRHQDAVGRLYAALLAHLSTHDVGRVFVSPVDVVLSDTSIVQPDIVYLGTDRLGLMSERGIEGPPTLVVEVLSPSTATIDRHTKMQLYARYGLPYYWIVDPDARAIEVYALRATSYELHARALGNEPLAAEPFSDLILPPASLWS